MNIQFPKRVGTTMVSVEGWYNNTNIMKEPRKGRFTSRRQMTHDTQLERDFMEAGIDRIAEAIAYVPRNQNNMVKVNYSNTGNPNAPKGTHAQPARNPYSMDVFRGPSISNIDLLPVSKQRQTTIGVMAAPNYKEFVQQRNTQNIEKILNLENLKAEMKTGKVYSESAAVSIVPELGAQYIQERNLSTQLNTNKVGYQSQYDGPVHIASGVTDEHLTYSLNPMATKDVDLSRETNHIDTGRYIIDNPLLVKDAQANTSSAFRPLVDNATPTTERRGQVFSAQATKSDGVTRFQWIPDQGPQTQLKAPIASLQTNRVSDITRDMDKASISIDPKYKFSVQARPEVKSTIPQAYAPRAEYTVNLNRLSTQQSGRVGSAF